MNKTIKHNGIEYYLPTVTLLKAEGLGISELAGRTAYNSYDKSENNAIKDLAVLLKEDEDYGIELDNTISKVNAIESSELLTNLAWVHHHHSVLEMCELWFFVNGTSRSVIQEHSRHRVQELTVQSTRYTMSSVINAFLASQVCGHTNGYDWFLNKVKEFDMFTIKDQEEDIHFMYRRLLKQKIALGEEKFIELATSKDMRNNGAINQYNPDMVFEALQSSKQARNIGDSFKHIVTDNWKVDLVFKMNLRSLKNYLKLRNSGAAYFLMRELAIAIQEAAPKSYLNLIVKEDKQ